ncbi:MAG TPA: hypothetical protein VEB60_01655 [Candidatus Paceibacterota bacterium]|nr:hypothetical protein [Candidatus Paceibacterota bacterium]
MDELERSPRLEKLKQRLQRREGSGFVFRRTPLEAEIKTPHKEWEAVSSLPTSRKATSSWLRLGLWLSMAFFAVAIAVAGFVFLQGSNIVSNRNIDIEIRGPLAVKAGNATDLEIALSNNNRDGLEAVDMVIEYPEGTRQVGDVTDQLVRSREMVGNIPSGQSVSRFAKAVFFGEENEPKKIRVVVEYRVSGSNALFEKEEWYEFRISGSPLNIVAETAKEINSGQEIALKIKAVSNSDAPLDNVIISVAYPSGFRYVSSSIRPLSAASDTWNLGTIAAGEQRQLEIKGTLEGRAHAGKTFAVRSGVARPDKNDEIDIVYANVPVVVSIKESFFDPRIVINENAQEEDMVLPGDAMNIPVKIEWINNVGAPLVDGQLAVTLEGRAIDKTSVLGNGFYRSSTNVISWDGKLEPSLASLPIGGKGLASFSFRSLPLVSPDGKTFTNPVFEVKAQLRASRLSAGFAHEEVKSVVTRRIKLSSIIGVAGKVFYENGPIANTGPLPPVVDAMTKYTVMWSVTNSSNDLKAATVKATLPLYVEWTGVVSPAGERVVYNPRTREVVWDLGDVAAGTGIGGRERSAAFQVSFVPSLSQVGVVPVLVSDSVFSGTDTFTGAVLSAKKINMDTVPSGDEESEHKDGMVVEKQN